MVKKADEVVKCEFWLYLSVNSVVLFLRQNLWKYVALNLLDGFGNTKFSFES